MLLQAALDGDDLDIAPAPELDPELDFYVLAFIDLSTERQYEGGPIPWSSIEEYARVCDLDLEQLTRLHRFTRALDGVVVEHHEKQREADKKKAERARNNRGAGGGRRPPAKRRR